MDIELTYIPESSTVFSPAIVVGELISVSFVGTNSNVFSPIISHGAIVGDLIFPAIDLFGSSQVFQPEIIFDQILDSSLFESSYFFLPYLLNNNIISIDGFIDDLDVYSPEIIQGAAQIHPVTFDAMRFFRPTIRQAKLSPVKFRFAETVRGGEPTQDNLSTLQDYRSVNHSSNYNDKEDFAFGHITGLIPDYIPVVDALVSNTYYRAMYITNPINSSPRTNVEFWINGGESYRIRTNNLDKIVHESEHLINYDEALYEVNLENKEYFKLSGKDRTSLYGNLQVDYLISPTPLLYPFNEEGVGIGINLSQESFTPGNVRSILPNLTPGKSIGIYLRVITKFSPDFLIPKDYAFLHLEYVSTISGTREKYPGQLRIGKNYVGILLPSISIATETNYSGIKPHLNQEVERFYNRYPPYFSHYEDI